MKNKIFGTDGIRGPYGTKGMNEDLAYSLGFSIGKYLEEEGLNNASILLGRDPRESGESLQKACASGIHQFGHQPFGALRDVLRLFAKFFNRCQLFGWGVNGGGQHPAVAAGQPISVQGRTATVASNTHLILYQRIMGFSAI